MGQPMRSTVRAQASQASTFGPSGVVAELFDAALDAVVLMDRFGHIAAWNRRAEETFGWTVDEVVGQRLSEVIIPKEQRLLHERGLRRTNNGKPHLLGQRLRLSALHRDGHEFPVELTIIALGAGAGRTYAGFVRDLTREEAAEAARSEAEVRYRSLVERLPGIAYVNEIGGETRLGCWERSPRASSHTSLSRSLIGFGHATAAGSAFVTKRSWSRSQRAAARSTA